MEQKQKAAADQFPHHRDQDQVQNIPQVLQNLHQEVVNIQEAISIDHMKVLENHHIDQEILQNPLNHRKVKGKNLLNLEKIQKKNKKKITLNMNKKKSKKRKDK